MQRPEMVYITFISSGLQRSVIPNGSPPYGLGLNETILPQYLKELGYSTHIVGKVFISAVRG